MGVDSDFGRDDSENTLGNPYFGIELHGNNSPLYGEIGVRLPLAPDTDENEAAIVGLFTELVDRAEAFISDAIPISGAINYRHKNPTGFVLRLRGGSALWIETGEGDETELFLLYSVQAGYESSKFNFIGGFTGRWWLNEDGDFGERTFHQLGLAANVAFGVARPGISFRVPLDEDMTDILDIVYGLTLSLNLM